MILRAHMRSRTPATGPSERTAPVLFVGVGAACRVLMSLSLKNGVFSIHTQTATGSDMTDTCLSRDLPDIADDLPFFTDCRRRLHRRPEEGWTEFESTWTVVSALKAMGCEVVTGADLIEPEAVMGRDAAKVEAAQRRALEAGVPEAFLTSLDGWTGAATTIDTGRPGPLTVFRFEIDCVCVSESLEPGRLPVDLGFASERPGLMHSCGHDMHAATGLTLARWVTANRDALCGRIRFVFQPAEEGVRGARAMVARGLARGADYLWTQHITTSIHENEIFASAGGFLATEKIDISFHGSSEFGTAVTAAAHATLAMQAIPRHSEGASRICVGTLEADAEKARMCVEVRGATQAVADFMSAGVRRAVESAAMLAGVTAGIEVAGRAEALLPNPTAVEMIVECAKRLPDVVITEDRTRGSDDSTLWMNAVTKDGGVAGCFHYGSRGRAGLHTSSFDPEGEFIAIPALRLSVELLLSTNRRGDA